MAENYSSVDSPFAAGEPDAVLRLDGPLTATTAHALRDAIQANRSPVVIIDMTDVPYVDSSGIGALVNAQVSSARNQQRLILTGLNERVRSVLRITHIDQVFAIATDIQEAQAMGHASDA